MSRSDRTFIMVAPQDINDISSRTTVRDRLGIAPGDIAIAAPGQVHRLSGHRFAVWAVSILKIADLPVRLIIQDIGPSARDVVEFAGMTGFAEQVILTGPEWSVSDLLSAADIALFLNADGMLLCSRPFSGWHGQVGAKRKLGRGGLSTRPSSTSFRLTVPPTVNEKNALLVHPNHPRQIAQALLKIIENITAAAGRSPAAVNDK